jgi:hypothetical protein
MLYHGPDTYVAWIEPVMLSALPLVSARRALWWLGSPAHGDVRYVREGNIWSPVNAASSLHNFFLRAGLWRWDEASPRGPTWRYVAWVCVRERNPTVGPMWQRQGRAAHLGQHKFRCYEEMGRPGQFSPCNLSFSFIFRFNFLFYYLFCFLFQFPN